MPIFQHLKSLLLLCKGENWQRYVVALFAVIVYLLVAHFSSSIAFYFIGLLLFFGYLLIGIPHGALDHLLLKDKRISLFKFVLNYVMIILLYFILWQYLPTLSLIVFIVFSSFHFGESELEDSGAKISSNSSYAKSFLLGLSILFFTIFSHFEESLDVIANIKGIAYTSLKSMDHPLYSLSIAGLSFLYILFQSVLSKRYFYLRILFILLIGVYVPLAVAFGLYFIVQHSYNAWGHLRTGLNLDSVSLYKKALPYTLGALMVFVVIVFINTNQVSIEREIWANVFIFLACISLPHFLLMHRFYKES